jgi:predicted acylesterase/phospholipase RssA/uncharacterized membrane protein (DUF485 family)
MPDNPAGRKKIFISYRPAENEKETSRLIEFLEQKFDKSRIIHQSTEAAAESSKPLTLENDLSDAYVMVALIDPAWTGGNSEGAPQISQSGDPVYRQVATALKQNIPVVTVLVNDGALPANGGLPEDLQPLHKLPAFRIRKGKMSYDAQKLHDYLNRIQMTDKITPPSSAKLALINQARSVIRGDRSLKSKELETLYKDLEKKDQFAYATEVLLRKMSLDESEGRRVAPEDFQRLARYIYKDHSLPSSFKFDRALNELKVRNDLANSQSCETLGLAGAIYKRKWQFDHQFRHLTLSCFYYQKGFQLWQQFIAGGNDLLLSHEQNDQGFTAINYAYINELMAVDRLEEQGRITGLSDSIFHNFSEAKKTREFILEQFVDPTDATGTTLKTAAYPAWVIATVAEAYFGLRRYAEANVFIDRYVLLQETQPWQIRTFNQQLFSLAYLQQFQQGFIQESGKGAQRLAGLLPAADEATINTCLQAFHRKSESGEKAPTAPIGLAKSGKMGLALSGGGFRASIFHIGVLAALAEKDELRKVEVLSCVSGGSIIGAFYYLKLKALLEAKGDDEIVRKDYIDLVKEIEKEFLEGVQQNLRMHLFSDLGSNFRMMYDQHYSRTHRLGELYEEHLYRPLLKRSNNEAYKKILDREEGQIYMTDLFIRPKDNPETFVPANDNWRRRNKVPQLVLNATTVNTGHNWQFTASWMGEPPGTILADIDVKPRLRRMYYEEAPERYQRFRLGYAVGASSCVPVMFKPMPLRDLYPGIDLQLIDGGLHDNQGIASLLEQECSSLFISDASGQLPLNSGSARGEVALFYRSDNILQERLRELQFQDIRERSNTTQVSRLVTVHLKNCLQKAPLNWKYCVDPPRSIMYTNTVKDENDLTEYGVLRSVQTQLSEIRTDLDSFSDAEAWALMYSGYVQTKYEWNHQTNEGGEEGKTEDWQFLRIKDYMTLPAKAATISKPLSEGKRLALKVFYLNSSVRMVALALSVLLFIGLVYLVATEWSSTLQVITVKFLVVTVIVYLLGLVSNYFTIALNIKAVIRRYLIMIGAAIIGFVVSNIYLRWLNPVYNRSGKLKEEKETGQR